MPRPDIASGYGVSALGEVKEYPVKNGLIQGWVQGKSGTWYRSKEAAEEAAVAIKATLGGKN